jgi:hypothetical protein
MSSSNTGVASVQTMGQSQPGLMSAVGVGTTGIEANYYSSASIPVQVTISGPLPLPACPGTNSFSAEAPVTVTPPPVKVGAVYPSPLTIGKTVSMAIGGSGFSGHPGAPAVAVTGGGVSVTSPTVATDASVSATYDVAASATSGPQTLTVSLAPVNGAGAATSNAFPITIAATSPVPASATLDEGPEQTCSNQTWASCEGTGSEPNRGWSVL